MKNSLNEPAVQSQIALYQNLIGRMSTLSGGVKMLGATVVGLVAVLGNGNLAQAAALSVFIFTVGFLDAYYLGKERVFRRFYDRFVKDLHEGKDITASLFVIEKPELKFAGLMKALASPSVWIFYLALILLTCVISVYGVC